MLTGRVRRNRKPRTKSGYLDVGYELIEELTASLRLDGDTELISITKNYFLEVVASKVINWHSIETKVACAVFTASRRKGYELSHQQITNSIVIESIQSFRSAIALCEQNSRLNKYLGCLCKGYSPEPDSEDYADFLEQVSALTQAFFGVPEDLK